VEELSQARERARALQLAELLRKCWAQTVVHQPWVVVIEPDQGAEGAHEVRSSQCAQQPGEMQCNTGDCLQVVAPEVLREAGMQVRQALQKNQALKCTESPKALRNFSTESIDQLCSVHSDLGKAATQTCEFTWFQVVEIGWQGFSNKPKQVRTPYRHPCIGICNLHQVSGSELLDAVRDEGHKRFHELCVKCTDASKSHCQSLQIQCSYVGTSGTTSLQALKHT